MSFFLFSQIIAVAGLIIGVLFILVRLNEIMRRPFRQDLSRDRGKIRRGILYAFTLGMAPWEKESTRRHWVAYLRGIAFHVGIFVAFGVLIAGPWIFPSGERISLIPILRWPLVLVTGFGAVAGFSGIFMRLSGENERALSLPDDYFSVLLSSLFIALACASLLSVALLPVFLIVTGVMSAYIPFSKIRHCVYFFYAKFFFGAGFGKRGVIGQSNSEYAETVE